MAEEKKEKKTLAEYEISDAEMEEIEHDIEEEKKAKGETEEAQRAREQAEKERADQERKGKQYDDEAQQLRAAILHLAEKLGFSPTEYKERIKKEYAVTKILDMKNEDKLKELQYLRGLKAQEEKEEEEKGLEDEFTKLRDKIGLSDIGRFYEWLKSEYGVTSFEALSLEGKQAVLEAMRKPIVTEKKEEEKMKGKEEEGAELNKWDLKTIHGKVKTDEGTFLFRFVDIERGLIECKNEEEGTEYLIVLVDPSCSCLDFEINKQRSEYCKHLKAAIALGLEVKELPKLPAVPERKPRERKGKKEELVTVEILDQEVGLPIQVPTEMIMSETEAVAKIKSILGDKPEKKNVIESYAGIEELSAHVIIAMAQATGVQYRPLVIEEETTQMSMGDIYMAVADEDQRKRYKDIAAMLPKVDVVTRCRITMLAGWKDRSGNMRIGMGTKEEYLTPHALADIAKRGAAFLRTMAETKAAKKAILNALPITDDGILAMIKQVYGW